MSEEMEKQILNHMIETSNTLGAIQSTLKSVEGQTKETNGKVKGLLQWKSNMEAVDKYKEKHPVVNNAENVVIRQAWYETSGGQKILIGIGLLISIIAAILALRGGVNVTGIS